MLKDGETDPTKGTVINVAGEASIASVDIGLLTGSSTVYAAKAASVNKEPIPVTFSWASDDEEVASVTSTSPVSAMISGNRKGNATVTMSADGRGIEVEFKVTVHDVVKGLIASTGDDTRLAIGDEITVNAEARDAAQDDDVAGPEGAVVPDITVTWMSSNEDVATVDEDGVVTAKGAGSADITAHVGDVTSNKISVTVFDVLTVERRLRVTNLPITGTYVGVTDSVIVDDGENTLVTSAATTVGAINVVVEQFDPTSGDSGAWAAVVADAAMVKYVSLDTDVLTFTDETSSATDDDYMGEASISTGSSGDANMPAFAADNSARGKVVGRGNARVEISTQYATTLYIEVSVTLPNTHKAAD